MTGCFHVWMWCGVLTFPLLIDPTGHEDKCNILLFHPLASSLLTSAACDGTVLIWDLEKKAVKITLDPHPEPVSGVCVCVRACVCACVCICTYYVCCDEKSLYRLWQLFAMAWSHDGKLLATVCKDQKIRIYNPRESTSPTHVS